MTDVNPFRETRNYRVYEQGVLLAILNRHFSITLVSPKKRSVVAKQFLTVRYLKKQTDVVDVEDFIQRRLKEIQTNAIKLGTPEKTATRRGENTRIVESIHILIDIVRELGYRTESKVNEGRNGNVSTETIVTIYIDKKVLKKEDIVRNGLAINNFLDSLLVANETIIISKFDKTLDALLNG
ncbi:hypothetical protein EIN_129870 [Entamoeba invadens IP1]|uniref:Uncharacterized protein n=1 Tax=Entamoeba invadens IP1 TaxID=370355 RepID=L7FMP8_ENTIV|nr:hypothetical protein EIN_129870 [Entamoeba invadens IP1]ELP91607.1 hypothetical protein EIN_129870 [Entamoeba invadens IP1]|eukprot:XP_004258378.1 hypothetical protein EIN_129870 [Entamoeba invadens IP1]